MVKEHRNSNTNNIANNNNYSNNIEKEKTDYERMLEGTFMTIEKDITELLEMGNLDFVKQTVRRKEIQNLLEAKYGRHSS